jgi:DNA-binding response OmpR family regulator
MHDRRKVLIIDDDPALRQSLAEQLEMNAEFVSAQCDTSAAALRVMRRERFDAVLLDGDLPDVARPELCRLLRQADPGVPILIMAAAGEGAAASPEADDYLPKPFRLNDLLGRLRAQLARSERGGAAIVMIGPYTFRPDIKLMVDNGDGRKVRLTDKEAAILQFLHRAGRVIDRDTLLGEVWGYNAGVTTHTLETHVYRLRRKIERDPARAEILVTEAGGYRLVA